MSEQDQIYEIGRIATKRGETRRCIVALESLVTRLGETLERLGRSLKQNRNSPGMEDARMILSQPSSEIQAAIDFSKLKNTVDELISLRKQLADLDAQLQVAGVI